MLLLLYFLRNRKYEMANILMETIELFGFYIAANEQSVYQIGLKGLKCTKQSEKEHNLLGEVKIDRQSGIQSFILMALFHC